MSGIGSKHAFWQNSSANAQIGLGDLASHRIDEALVRYKFRPVGLAGPADLERCLICARTFLPRMLKAQASIASVILRSHLIWLPRRLCRSGIEPSRPGNGKRVQAPPSCHLAHTAFDDHEFTS